MYNIDLFINLYRINTIYETENSIFGITRETDKNYKIIGYYFCLDYLHRLQCGPWLIIKIHTSIDCNLDYGFAIIDIKLKVKKFNPPFYFGNFDFGFSRDIFSTINLTQNVRFSISLSYYITVI